MSHMYIYAGSTHNANLEKRINLSYLLKFVRDDISVIIACRGQVLVQPKNLLQFNLKKNKILVPIKLI